MKTPDSRLRAWPMRNEMLFDNSINLYFFTKTHLAEPLVLVPRTEGVLPVHPAATLDATATQELMDKLWQCGFRPSEGTGSAGAFKAVQDHLQDMRSLVFKTKIIKGP